MAETKKIAADDGPFSVDDPPRLIAAAIAAYSPISVSERQKSDWLWVRCSISEFDVNPRKPMFSTLATIPAGKEGGCRA